jgi:hypothetical protein
VPHHKWECHINKIGGGPKKYVDFDNKGAKKLILEIGGPKLQKYQNRGTKSAFKPKLFLKLCKFVSICFKFYI